MVLFYYTGHGIMNKGRTLAGTNCEKGSYPLEGRLTLLSSYKQSYVIGLLDCCREELKQDTKGGPCDEDEETDADNLIITFGCLPNDGVQAESTIIKNYIKHLKAKAAKKQGRIIAPFDI